MSLAGKHALVTGGGSGAGAAIARALAGAGASVTIAGRNTEALAAVAGAEMRIVTGDVTKPDEVAAMFEAASTRWGAPSIVVANAGGATSRPFLKTAPQDFAATVELNLGGVFATWRAGLAPMVAAGWGRLIAVASTAGLKGYPYVAGYCAAKHGVIGLTRALALETVRTGVTVNAVCPGYMLTPMLERSIETIMARTGRTRAEAEAPLRAANPQGRFIDTADVAAAILWLASDAAASVTGQAISISGGEA